MAFGSQHYYFGCALVIMATNWTCTDSNNSELVECLCRNTCWY